MIIPSYTRVRWHDPDNLAITGGSIPVTQTSALELQAAKAVGAWGLNFTGMGYENWRWNNAGGYHDIIERLNSAYVNLTGAEQYSDALMRAAELRARRPHTGILWRHMIHKPPGSSEHTDKGMWRLPAHEFVDNVVIAHGYHTRGFYTVTDCEGSIDRQEVRRYAEMEAERLDYGVPKNCKFAVLRMSTHHPSHEVLDSGDLDPLLAAVKRNMGSFDRPNVVLSPNVYFNDTNADALDNIKRIEQRCIDRFGFRPVIVLGEYGFDKGIGTNLESESGWRAAGLSSTQHIERLVSRWHETPGHWYGNVYCVGFSSAKKVNTFALDMQNLNALAVAAPTWNPPPAIDPRPPVVELPPTPTPEPEPPIDDEDTTDVPVTFVTHVELESALLKLEARLDNTYRQRIERLEQTIDALRTALNVQARLVQLKESA